MKKRRRGKGKSSGGSGRPPAESRASDRPEARQEEARQEEAEAKLKLSGWIEDDVIARRQAFPDPRSIDEPVRLAMTPEASAAMIGHAGESLDAEVCGVLVGELREDDQGVWVWVGAAIRGTATERGGTHVTYTQETWDEIHRVKDRDYPKLHIVGWYHSHPGFGVEFSDMDRFIQQNFFPGPTQFALVLDPLSGDASVCVNSPDGIRLLSRFWVGGRERTCQLPPDAQGESVEAGKSGEPANSGEAAESGAVAKRLQAVEERLQQFLQTADADRAARYSVLLFVAMLATAALVLWISFMIWDQVYPSDTPPEDYRWMEVPIELPDGNRVFFGAKIVRWKVPPEVYATLFDHVAEKLKAEEEKEAQQRRQREAKKKQSESEEAGKPATKRRKAK